MARGGAITGLVRHASGEPAPAVRVEVLPLDAQADLLTGSIVTDDRGVYRAFGLPPGKYVVSARIGDTTGPELMQFSDTDMDGILEKLKRRPGRAAVVTGVAGPGATAPASTGLPAVGTERSPTYGRAPIFHPGTADPEQAAVLVVAAGDERSGIDVVLRLVRTVAIEGRVSSASDAAPAGTQITLTPTRIDRNPRADLRLGGQRPAAGRGRELPVHWCLAGPVPSPRPRVDDRRPLGAHRDHDQRSGRVGISLALPPGLRWSGRIAFDAQARTPPADLTSLRLRPLEVTGAAVVVPFTATRPDGTFGITSLLPGTYRHVVHRRRGLVAAFCHRQRPRRPGLPVQSRARRRRQRRGGDIHRPPYRIVRHPADGGERASARAFRRRLRGKSRVLATCRPPHPVPTASTRRPLCLPESSARRLPHRGAHRPGTRRSPGRGVLGRARPRRGACAAWRRGTQDAGLRIAR